MHLERRRSDEPNSIHHGYGLCGHNFREPPCWLADIWFDLLYAVEKFDTVREMQISNLCDSTLMLIMSSKFYNVVIKVD